MLTIWRRHKRSCPHKDDRYYRKCRCAVHCEGTVEGVYRRQSLKTSSWERAVELAREIEDGKKKPSEPAKSEPEGTALTKAIEVFTRDLRAQDRCADTVRKYRLLFSQISAYAATKSLNTIDAFSYEVLVDFRALWTEGAATRNKKLDRLKAFFTFCHDAGWVTKNPTKSLKPAKASKNRVQPFSKDEQERIVAKPQTSRIRAFVHTIFYSGLRISDCCFLRPEDFDGNCIRRQNRKNQEYAASEIYVPIPPSVKAELDKLPLTAGYFFLIGESTNLHTQTDAWRTILNDVLKTEVPDFHPHRFRHTRVVEWLAHGLTLEEISGMIGTSVKVLEKHYASFAPARQQVVKDKLDQLWNAKPRLLRVK